MIKNRVRRMYGLMAGLTLLTLLTAGAGTASPESGNRIWDGSKGMNTTYTWNSFSFSGFYYNLDDNLTTEELTINNINRTVMVGDITYTTSPIEVNFAYSPFGKYQVIGFMADKYFAGYTSNSTISDREISIIGGGLLQKVLLDDEDRRTVYVGGTLTLKEGYVLKIKEIDIGGGPGQVFIVLLKDGEEVDSGVVAGGSNYVFRKQVASISDLPILAVHFETVFRGAEVNAAFIKGVFQISDSYTQISSGDRFGVMEITGVNKNQIAMDNRNPVDLSSGNTVDLMGDLKIVVADNSSVLRFALSAERMGSNEVRGTIYPVTDVWTPLNFGLNIGGTSMGFYYDMDKDIGTERLEIAQISGDSIPDGGLVYSTSPQEIGFDYSGFGSFQVIGFTADRYFAGYTSNSVISANKAVNTLGSGQLHRVLIDDKNTHAVYEGGTLALKEGYVLKANAVDVGAGTGQVWLVLLKDGTQVDDGVVAGGDTYIYSKKVGSVSDFPIIAVHVDTVFRGREVNAAFARGVFQISEAVTEVRSGDRYGQMEVSKVSTTGIEMDNPTSIGLSRGSTLNLMGNINLRVADSNDVRFYPYVMISPEMVANQLIIDAPARATAGDTIKIKITAGGSAIEAASVIIGSVTGLTDPNGVLDVTLPKTLKGTYNITAIKLGYADASKSIEVASYVERKLYINAPTKANQFDTIAILVTYNGSAVGGANITYDNATIGTTGSDGTLNYSLAAAGTHTIKALKTGYIAAEMDIDVRMPYSEFRALDINITPDVVSTGGSIVVRSNITNSGTRNGTLPVVLIINNTEVENMSVALAPGEIKEISFTRKVTLPAGNYTVEILGQKRSVQLIESKKIPFNGTVNIIGTIVLIYFFIGRERKRRMLQV